MSTAADRELADFLSERRGRLDPDVRDALEPAALDRLLCASDFAFEALRREPGLCQAMLGPPAPPPPLEAGAATAWPGLLRRFRRDASLGIAWRDVSGADDIEATLAASTRVAEQCIGAALAALESQMRSRHGRLRDGDGAPLGIVVFALGKLGGGELNFSSDVDLVFAYPGAGHSEGERSLDADAWMTRLGQQLIRLLDEVTPDGQCHRVDMRLRPFGASGRLALPFAAMEQYFQREGRDWERYAWVKARPVAGDVDAGDAFLTVLRPFVYRRYLDYTALDGLREMKGLIAAEVVRRELADNIKLGPGGIREIEFLVQALQLIRGGREPALRVRGLLPGLRAMAEAGHLTGPVAHRLADAYRFLRRLENRLQMHADQQVHALPEAPFARERLAVGLGRPCFDALRDELEVHRRAVVEEFERLLAPRRSDAKVPDLAVYWRRLAEADPAHVPEPGALAVAGFPDPAAADARLREFARSASLRALSARGRRRLDHVLPALLQSAGRSGDPQAVLPRVLRLIQAIARRTSYLALLDERPAARQRLVDVMCDSALLAERLAEHPLLLDELLDTRAGSAVPDRDDFAAELARLLRPVAVDDPEEALRVLNEFRHGIAFRLGFAVLDGRLSAVEAARRLAWLAEATLLAALPLAEHDLLQAHGRIPDAGLAIVGYGSFGGEELGFASDLDLVFLYACSPEAMSDGARPIEAARWYARLVQKLIGLLGTVTPAGRLYEVDLRLRPDGAGGLLVTSMDSFAAYQRQRAWTWEHQALVRGRAIGGRGNAESGFEQIRQRTLVDAGRRGDIRADVLRMRQRMRADLDRSRGDRFDLKQGEGGLVDLEFVLQALVLLSAAAHPRLAQPRHTVELIAALAEAGVLEAADAQRLVDAHALLLARGFACTLDERPRVLLPDEALEAARAGVREVCRRHGLDFRSPPERPG